MVERRTFQAVWDEPLRLANIGANFQQSETMAQM